MSVADINVTLYTPEPYQRAVHDGLAKHWQCSMHFVKSVRQKGKSMMCENILVLASLQHPNQKSGFVAPTLRQAKPLYKDIVHQLKPLIAESNGSDLELTFINGSSISFMSAEQGDNLRGFTVTAHGILIVDEAAYIPDEVFYAVTPFVNANNAPILCVSTPRFRQGFFYDFYTDGTHGAKNIYSYDFNDWPNPYITEDRLAMLKKKMPLNLFRADYLGEWMEATSDLFGNFQAVMNNSVTEGKRHTAGLDWGVGKAAGEKSDSTALSIFNEHRQQVRLYNWNDLDETQTIKAIVHALRGYDVRKVVVERNSIGAVYLGLLKKAIADEGLPCVVLEFNTTNDTKRQVIEAFIVEVQNRTCQLLDDAEQKVQLAAYQMERTPSGKVTYNAAKGYHDDIIMADAFALHGMRSAQYAIR